ncbi:MAG: thiamine phosphate synthase [Clostridiales bacterium]|nr:thiamine phosphate synthase [Clostridiales bacterium]
MKPIVDYSLYLCTDRELMTSATIEECVEAALKGGVTIVQLREKTCTSKEFYEIGKRVHQITRAYRVPLIINDRVDIALAIGAEGVHVGSNDLPCQIVRRIAGDDMLIGVSVSTKEEALQAEKSGADYVGVGAMYATKTKTDAVMVSMEELNRIRQAISLPIVTIGGMNRQTIKHFKHTGIDGVAVVSAIVATENPESAAKELFTLWKN